MNRPKYELQLYNKSQQGTKTNPFYLWITIAEFSNEKDALDCFRILKGKLRLISNCPNVIAEKNELNE